MDFEKVWQDIRCVVNNGKVIYTLAQERENTIIDANDYGLLVVTRRDPEFIEKEWIEAAWNVLVEKGRIIADDIPGTAKYRSSFIMALLAQLEYVRAERRPNTLILSDNISM